MFVLPENTITIEEFIKSGNGVSISYFNLSFIDMVSNGTWVSVRNVISDYISELRNASIKIKLNKDQQLTYFYKPKLLCYDLYGNPELYFIILLMNDMADVKEFTKPVIRMLKKDHMSELMSLIYNAESSSMRAYNNSKV